MYYCMARKNDQTYEVRVKMKDVRCKACGSRNMEHLQPRYYHEDEDEDEELVLRWVCKDCVPEAIRAMMGGGRE